jgi:hypothetical protein
MGVNIYNMLKFQTLYTQLIKSSQQSNEVGFGIFPTLQMEKVRDKEFKYLSQRQTTNKRWSKP